MYACITYNVYTGNTDVLVYLKGDATATLFK